MEDLDPTVARQLGQAVRDFEQRRTGRLPKSVTVVLNENTLAITLHGALSPAEKALAGSPAAPPRCRSSIGSCSTTPPTRCGGRSKGSSVWRCAKRAWN